MDSTSDTGLERKKSAFSRLGKKVKKAVTPRAAGEKDGKEGRLANLFRNSLSSAASTPRGSAPSTPTKGSLKSGDGVRSSPLAREARAGPVKEQADLLHEDAVSIEPKSEPAPDSPEFFTAGSDTASARSGPRSPHVPSSHTPESLTSGGKDARSPAVHASPGQEPASLATLQEPVSGGGRALPFGEEPGQLQGYTALPDPQGEHYSKVTAENQKRGRGGRGKGAKVAGFILVAGIMGAAGFFISSHGAIRKDSGDNAGKKKVERKRWF